MTGPQGPAAGGDRVRAGDADRSLCPRRLSRWMRYSSASFPGWLSFSADEKSGKILARPDRHEMESGVEEQLIVEFYSR